LCDRHHFVRFLKSTLNATTGKRQWSNRTIGNIIAHLKSFTKFIDKFSGFPLGDPMKKVKTPHTTSLLEVERALTPKECSTLLDNADYLLETGGRSKDRRKIQEDGKRPLRKCSRPHRDRAVIYTFIETGMRRTALTKIRIDDVDFTGKAIRTEEKGGGFHKYKITTQALEAIKDYILEERPIDDKGSLFLFLPAGNNVNAKGKLSVRAINRIWDKICLKAGIRGKTPHCARHAMGKRLMEKTGNIEAVQRQLGHKNVAYSMSYARITDKELDKALESDS